MPKPNNCKICGKFELHIICHGMIVCEFCNGATSARDIVKYECAGGGAHNCCHDCSRLKARKAAQNMCEYHKFDSVRPG